MKNTNQVVIIGAGPVGLAATANLLERGQDPVVFEAGPEPAFAIKQWQHIELFSPWKFNIDPSAVRLLQKNGWQTPSKTNLPMGKEFRVEYLLPLAELPEMSSRIRLNSKITAVSRKNWDKVKNVNRSKFPFLITVQQPDGNEYQFEAKAVIDSSGTWFNPNPVGSSGIPAPGEKKNEEFITYGIPDVRENLRSVYAGQTVAVVGSGHSAMHVVLDLLKLQDEVPDTRVHWIMRNTNLTKVFGRSVNDQLEARGELGERAKQAVETGVVKLHTPFLLQSIERLEEDHNLRLTGDVNGTTRTIAVDRIVGTTGFRPDLDIIREVRTAIDPAIESVKDLAPLIDPNIHNCGSVPPHGVNELKHPDENFFIAGIKSYGRAPTFLLATGYEQVRSIAAYLAGHNEEAGRLELNLTETGFCSTDLNLDSVAESTGCCGGPVSDHGNTCCVKDTQSENQGESGCKS